MMRRTDELEAFKARINLTQYAASQGYTLDRKASSRNAAVMKSGAGDKVVIALSRHDRHWMYFSVGNDRDNGSIIDFVQNHQGGSLGAVRKELRPWLDGHSASLSRPAPDLFLQSLEPISKDLAQVRARYEAMESINARHAYLERERKLPASVLGDLAFQDRIRVDRFGNAVFPHCNRQGICGYEIKNKGFTGFAPGGEKGLWCSRAGQGDTALLIAETAIDALSYAAIKGTQGTRFLSTAGALNQSQPDLIKGAIQKLPEGGTVVLAFDNDAGGDELTEKVKTLLGEIKPAECILLESRPPDRGKDWNDVLRASVALPDVEKRYRNNKEK